MPDTDRNPTSRVLVRSSHPVRSVVVVYLQVPAAALAFGIATGAWVVAATFCAAATGVFYRVQRRSHFSFVEAMSPTALVAHRVFARPASYQLGPHSRLDFFRTMFGEYAVLTDEDGRRLRVAEGGGRDIRPLRAHCAEAGVLISPEVRDVG